MTGIKPFKQFTQNLAYADDLVSKAMTSLKGFDQWDRAAREAALESVGTNLDRAFWTLNNSRHVAGEFGLDRGLPQVIVNARTHIQSAVGHLNLHKGFEPEDTVKFLRLASDELAIAKAVPESKFVGGEYPARAFNIVQTVFEFPSLSVRHIA